MLNQGLSKRLSFASIIICVLGTDSSESNGGGGQTEPLRVEVGHDELEAMVLATDEILDRDLHIIEVDEGRACEVNKISAMLKEALSPLA